MRTFTVRRGCGRLGLLLRPDSQKATRHSWCQLLGKCQRPTRYGKEDSVIVAWPYDPQTTSTPAPVRGIDRHVLGETRLHLDTSQPIPRTRRPTRQQPL